jgi:CRP/FNR family transcriptional regulator, cyclic AMP receptor protein
MSTPLPKNPLNAMLLDEISQRGGLRNYPAHAVIVNEGDESDSLYIVVKGRLKVYTSSDDGRELVMSEHGAGEFFGELALDGGRRSASVKTLEPTSCRVVPGSEVRHFLAQHPDFALHLVRHLGDMVRRLTDQVRSLALEGVYARLARLLIENSELEEGIRVVRRRLTQQDMADRIGASREMVNRVLRDLATGGYVALDKGRVKVLKALPPGW